MRLSFLDRFRPVGAPGAAGTAVPAQDPRGPAEELAPVFAALRPDIQAAEQSVAQAAREADAAIAAAAEAAGALVAQARLDAAAARAQAAADVERAAEEADAHLTEIARHEAERIDAAAAAQMPDAVGLVLERLRRDLLGSAPEAGPRRASDDGGAR